MVVSEADLTAFYELSETLTGFDQTELRCTAVAPEYFDKLVEAVGPKHVTDLLRVFNKTRGSLPMFRQHVWNDKENRFAPIARNIILLWYLSTWFPLPEDWYKEFAPEIPVLEEQVISASAYKEGLVWNAIGVNAPGSKPPGFASWTVKPGSYGFGVATSEKKKHAN